MSKLSRGGIAYNLETSPYTWEVIYSNDLKIRYMFSSEYYLNKFKEKQMKNREKIEESLSKRFGLTVLLDELSDIVLYSKIEIRGFFIYINEVEYKCLNTIKLNGVKVI